MYTGFVHSYHRQQIVGDTETEELTVRILSAVCLSFIMGLFVWGGVQAFVLHHPLVGAKFFGAAAAVLILSIFTATSKKL